MFSLSLALFAFSSLRAMVGLLAKSSRMMESTIKSSTRIGSKKSI